MGVDCLSRIDSDRCLVALGMSGQASREAADRELEAGAGRKTGRIFR
jgi:hypothetical protein